MGKRANGEGTVYKRADGRWVATITLENGKRKSYYFKTQKEAIKAIQRASIARDEGNLIATKDQLLRDFLTDWLECTARPRVRLSTFQRYREVMQQHILPTLGQVKLQKLSPQHLSRLYARKQQEGYDAATIHQMHHLLHRALNDALLWNLVVRNISDAIKPPPIPKREMQVLSVEQAQQFLGAIKGDRLEALYVLALTTGMRQGELLALKWSDLDLSRRVVRIQRSIRYVNNHGMIISEPKTRAGRRQIELTDLATITLRKHRVHQQEARLLAGTRWQDQGWVFTSRWGTPVDARDLRKNAFPTMLAKAGLPRMRFHDLRHSAATLLLTMRTHPKIVQELLGHSNIGTTLGIYSHVMPSMQREAMSQLDGLLAGT